MFRIFHRQKCYDYISLILSNVYHCYFSYNIRRYVKFKIKRIVSRNKKYLLTFQCKNIKESCESVKDKTLITDDNVQQLQG